MQLKEGDSVMWSSQARGRTKTKTGIIAEAVAVGGRPDRNRFPSLYTSSGCGFGRMAS